ncbi:MAG: hypothetical protein RBT52_01905 [Sulfurimonas sp.]|jgi:hypothetical protein|nr:hypothetical protein [Sulfurimonas sp.]
MPDYSAMWEQYKKDVLNRIQNPGQTLAIALKEGIPTEENPLGMFGFGGITKLNKGTPSVFTSGRTKEPIPSYYSDTPSNLPEGTRLHKDNEIFHLKDGTILYKISDGSFVDKTGSIRFEDKQQLLDSILTPTPKVFKSNRPSSLNYKDPFKDTTKW